MTETLVSDPDHIQNPTAHKRGNSVDTAGKTPKIVEITALPGGAGRARFQMRSHAGD